MPSESEHIRLSLKRLLASLLRFPFRRGYVSNHLISSCVEVVDARLRTLVPKAINYAQQMRLVVREVARLFPAAIISGRGREKVEGFVKLDELFYAGSHGMDIAGPKVSRTRAKLHAVDECKCNFLVACFVRSYYLGCARSHLLVLWRTGKEVHVCFYVDHVPYRALH